MRFALQENLAKRLLFIDGLSRCGKSMLTNIIPSLDRVEHIQFITLIEKIVPGVALGVIDPNFARSMMRTMLNENIYDMRIGRTLNLRIDDQSGILNFKNPSLYFARLAEAAGDAAVEDLRRSDNFFPFQTHELMVNLDVLLKLQLDFYMIAMFRHPIDNAYSWWTRGWGERFGNDPRAFTLTIEFLGKKLPWYCCGYEKLWLSANLMERCALTVSDLILRSIAQYRRALIKKRIMLLRFEDFAASPDMEIARICKFLDVRTTDLTPFFIHQARCPRSIDLKARKRKLNEFKRSTRPAILKRLLDLSDHYESSFYDLRRK